MLQQFISVGLLFKILLHTSQYDTTVFNRTTAQHTQHTVQSTNNTTVLLDYGCTTVLSPDFRTISCVGCKQCNMRGCTAHLPCKKVWSRDTTAQGTALVAFAATHSVPASDTRVSLSARHCTALPRRPTARRMSSRGVSQRATPALVVPSTRHKTNGDRAFSVTTALAWNSLLQTDVPSSASLALFRQRLKTKLFIDSFGANKWHANCKVNDPKVKKMLPVQTYAYTLLNAFITYVRPILEYNSPVWSPRLHKHIDMLEIGLVRRRFTKRLPGMFRVSYDDRLAALQLERLEARWLRMDVLTTYKIIFWHTIINSAELFKLNTEAITRGHHYKIVYIRSNCETRRHFLSNLVVRLWNKLPADTNFSTLANFKRCIDIFDFDRHCVGKL